MVGSGIAAGSTVVVVESAIGFLGNTTLATIGFAERVSSQGKASGVDPHLDGLIAGHLKRGGVAEVDLAGTAELGAVANDTLIEGDGGGGAMIFVDGGVLNEI